MTINHIIIMVLKFCFLKQTQAAPLTNDGAAWVYKYENRLSINLTYLVYIY